MPFFSKSVQDLSADDLKELLIEKATENVRLEFKTDVPGPDEMLKKLSSFANTFGGYLIIGASASSKDSQLADLPGVAPQSSFNQTIIQRCHEGIWPPIDAIVSSQLPSPSDPSKVCYVIYVPVSAEAPHFLTKRRGAWIRTDEFSQRFEPRLATYEELEHLANRRALVVSRREQLFRRSQERFEALVASDYAKRRDVVGTIGATLSIGVCPLFPSRRLLEDQNLLQMLRTTNVPWRTLGFPFRQNQEVVTQHESVLLRQPCVEFSLIHSDIWGHISLAMEIERVEQSGGTSIRGIHLYSFLGYMLVFLEYVRVLLGKLGYNGPLIFQTKLARVRNVPFLFSPGWSGSAISTSPSSTIDDNVSIDIVHSYERLREERDGIVGDIIRALFFALNWPQEAADVTSVANSIRKAYLYNGWTAPR